MLFAKEVYRLTRRFPREEQFGFTLQVRKAAISVFSNIAEGHSRQGKEFRYFQSISRGSLAEALSQLIFAAEIQYIEHSDLTEASGLAEEIRRMKDALTAKLSSVP